TRSRTFTRKLDAERFLERSGTEMQRGEWIDPSVRRTSFNEWANAWWPTTSKLRPNTRRGYWLLLQNHVLPYFGSCQLGAIDYLDVERFIADKLRDGHGAKQVREMVTVISLIMQCAIRTNARRDNPAMGHLLRLPKPPTGSGRRPGYRPGDRSPAARPQERRRRAVVARSDDMSVDS
ncbi:MAG TPA: N-terminal phage integrase SAM-like domain-containing protein, partial [Acidimicrobiales bacterium]|nr:N-terminal phage integrase SAM-like domain-containing protein [Acidimicrobiales bacterium]